PGCQDVLHGARRVTRESSRATASRGFALGGGCPPGYVPSTYLQQEPLQQAAPGAQQRVVAVATVTVAPTRMNNRAKTSFLIFPLRAEIPLPKKQRIWVNPNRERFLDPEDRGARGCGRARDCGAPRGPRIDGVMGHRHLGS